MRYTICIQGQGKEFTCESEVLPQINNIIDIGDVKSYIVKSVRFYYKRDKSPIFRNGMQRVDYQLEEILVEVG